MRFLLQFEMGKHHCIDCPIKSENYDCCRMQLTKSGEYIEFDSWESQLENCPLEQLMDLKTQERYMTSETETKDVCPICGAEMINNYEVTEEGRVYYKQCLACEYKYFK